MGVISGVYLGIMGGIGLGFGAGNRALTYTSPIFFTRPETTVVMGSGGVLAYGLEFVGIIVWASRSDCVGRGQYWRVFRGWLPGIIV